MLEEAAEEKRSIEMKAQQQQELLEGELDARNRELNRVYATREEQARGVERVSFVLVSNMGVVHYMRIHGST